jgi:hypothetical protein
MASAPRIAGRTGGLAAAALFIGCGQLTGLDEYTISDPARYLDGPECQACLDARCSVRFDQCDANCQKTLACRRACADPWCHFACGWPDDDQARWATAGPALPADEPVATCARDFCTTECAIGQGWACVGDYGWGARASGDLIIRHKAFVGFHWPEPIRDATVVACSRASSCSSPLAGPALTDERGLVELTIHDARDGSPYLLFAGNSDYPSYAVFGKDKPRYAYEYSAFGMVPWAEIENWPGAEFDPSRGYVLAGISDCAGFAAEQMEIELMVQDGELRPCMDCEMLTLPDGGVLFAGLEPARVELTARQPATGKLVASTNMTVHPNRIHHIRMMPLTTSQAQQIQ